MNHVLERDVDAVRILTANNPETLNALTLQGARALGERLEAAADGTVRTVVLTGAGQAGALHR